MLHKNLKPTPKATKRIPFCQDVAEVVGIDQMEVRAIYDAMMEKFYQDIVNDKDVYFPGSGRIVARVKEEFIMFDNTIKKWRRIKNYKTIAWRTHKELRARFRLNYPIVGDADILD